jgi:tRNA (cytidine/uridine-2'-O-)-methyltransferase
MFEEEGRVQSAESSKRHEQSTMEEQARSAEAAANESMPLAHVVLYQPEIPQNTGNIARTCAAVNARLWIVRPAGFRLDDRHLRRAGLDYWEHVRWDAVDNWNDLLSRLEQPRIWMFSRFASQALWDADLHRGDTLLFGSESAGLPPSFHQEYRERSLVLPTMAAVRSLNLATTAGIALYEMLRRFPEAVPRATPPGPVPPG